MTIEQLRLKHSRFIYKHYSIATDDSGITITHEFLLEPDIVFRPKVTIPRPPQLPSSVGAQAISFYAFHLGMVEAISYWKAACPKEFVVEAGALSKEQIRFWYDLFLHGLGEFFYRNEIDFTKEGFLEIRSRPKPGFEDKTRLLPREASSGDLILVGGGKDSAVTLALLKESKRNIQTMVLNPIQAALENIRVSGLPAPIVVQRTIDPKLLELNNSGYLNGHTPFSAYLAFLGITVATLYGYENVIVSNEKSASEGNVMYHGMEVNHQYSKSFRFETMFRKAFDDRYFSFLRPLNDLQISKLFSQFPQFFSTFRSCNAGRKTNSWCGTCPKCAFTYLTLSPLFAHEEIITIFGEDFLEKREILAHIRAMVGLTPVKPFECVGTRDEAKLAVYLASERFPTEGLLLIKSDLNLTQSDIAQLKTSVLENWGDTYNLPEEHLALLRAAYERDTR